MFFIYESRLSLLQGLLVLILKEPWMWHCNKHLSPLYQQLTICLATQSTSVVLAKGYTPLMLTYGPGVYDADPNPAEERPPPDKLLPCGSCLLLYIYFLVVAIFPFSIFLFFSSHITCSHNLLKIEGKNK